MVIDSGRTTEKIFLSFPYICINKGMDIQQIRRITGYNPHVPTQKTATAGWLAAQSSQYQYAVTLTFVQKLHVSNAHGEYYRTTNREDIEKAVEKFQQKLNLLVFKNEARRRGRKLSYLPVLEGLRNTKHLHIHMSIGGSPSHILPSEFITLVKKAASLVPLCNQQSDIQIMDSGWMDYMCKEVANTHTDNVLWQLT